MVGKWHLGFCKKEYTPTYRGFYSFYGYLLGAEDYYTHERCISKKDNRFCGIDLHDNEEAVRNETKVYSTRLFTSRAERIVAEHANSRSDKPLFLYLPLQAVHTPQQVPDEYTRPYDSIKGRHMKTYADNGGEDLTGGDNYPLRGWKGSLWEGGIRGVGFVNSPLLEKNGTTTKELMHVSDWFPTLMHLAGADATGLNLDGFNQWPTISKGEPSERKELLHNTDPKSGHHGKILAGSVFDVRVRAAVRVGRWKLLTGKPDTPTTISPTNRTCVCLT